MYGLPPPPKYPVHTLQAGADGKPISYVEVSNKITWPKEELIVGEGSYMLRDDLLLATPPPHPSEAPIFNPNPLATSPLPPTTGVKICITPISAKNQQRPQASRLASAFSPGAIFEKTAEQEREPRGSEDTGTGTATGTSESGSQPYGNRAPIYGAGNPNLAPGQSREKEKDKRRKPKTDLKKTSSSFISRFVPREELIKKLESRNGEYLAMFANINRSFVWLDITESAESKKDNLTKIMFAKAHALCHDLNESTKRADHIDIVMGTNLADIIWYEPMSQKYSRINKNGAINASPVSQVRWIPGSENLFLAAHLDGTLVVYDKEREDAPFQPETTDPSEQAIETPIEDRGEKGGMEASIGDISVSSGEAPPTTPSTPGGLQIHKSVNSRNQKTNPVASYQVSNQRINAFAFSPDGRHLAVASEDGTLHIINYIDETVLDLYRSYFDGFTCVCWSPDGRYVVTGSKDDLVTVWSLDDRRIVCRCVGHESWVSAVAFDPWRCDGRDYRFGSVGEDRRLLLWDFGPGMLHAPKAVRRGQTGSVVSLVSGARVRAESMASLRLRSTTSLAHSGEVSGLGMDEQTFMDHAVESRKVVPELPPVLKKVIDDDPLSHISFREDCIITSCCEGHVKTWDRPKTFGFGAIGVNTQPREVHRPDTPKSREESHPHQRTDGV